MNCIVFNTNAWSRKELLVLRDANTILTIGDTNLKQSLKDGSVAVLVDVPSMGYVVIGRNVICDDQVFIYEVCRMFVLLTP